MGYFYSTLEVELGYNQSTFTLVYSAGSKSLDVKLRPGWLIGALVVIQVCPESRLTKRARKRVL